MLKRDSRTVVVKLADSAIANPTAGATQGTLADAEEVLQKMGFERMMLRIVERQKAAHVSAIQEMAASTGAKEADINPFVVFQKKVMDATVAAMDIEGMKGDLTRIYSETFTKDELRGIADFYGTAAGQALLAKEQEVGQKLHAVLSPRFEGALSSFDALAEEFVAEQAKKLARTSPPPAAAAKE